MDSKTHALHCGFSFWYLKKQTGKQYTTSVKTLGTFNTIESFWSYYCHLTRPNELPNGVDCHLFREGITPLWEDASNRNGGKWVIRLKKGMANRCWENALLALIGDTYNLGDELCGVVISTKFQEDTLSFWSKTANDKSATNKLRDAIKKLLSITSNSAMEYKPHNTALKSAFVSNTGGSPGGSPRSSPRSSPRHSTAFGGRDDNKNAWHRAGGRRSRNNSEKGP